MKVCKIKPDYGTCSACYDTAEFFDEIPMCDKCGQEEYELLETHCSFWNDYAVIIKDGKLEKVSMWRVYDIREKGGEG
jgi:hypothetical protein